MADPPRYPEPKRLTRQRWVRVSVILALVLILVVVVLLLTLGRGGHKPSPGPGQHNSSPANVPANLVGRTR
jgi:hypothetical protein